MTAAEVPFLWAPLWNYLRTGGPVMVPLVALSLWMWHLIVLQGIRTWRAGRRVLPAAEAIARLAESESPSDRKSEPGPGPVRNGPRAAALNDFLARRRREPETDRILWDVSIRRQLPPLGRNLTAILVLAAAAPLLGLLGTVTGMVETFRTIGVQGAGNPQALASGIQEALVTTQTGLLVAIPGLLAGQILRKRVRNLRADLIAFHQAVDRRLEGGRHE